MVLDPDELVEQRELEGVEIASAVLDGLKLPGLRLTDIRGSRLNASGGDWRGCGLLYVELLEARLIGLDLAEGSVREVRFEGCKLDYVNFRMAGLDFVTFENCELIGADFQGARLNSVRFSHCRLAEADFTKATLANVDFRGSELAGIAGSLIGLRGAIVDSLQLMDLSAPLAAELGIKVE